MHFTSLTAEALAPIRARFLSALHERAARLAIAVEEAGLTRPDAVPEAVPDAVMEDIHKLRGVAPMLGLRDLGQRAAEAEDRLEAWLAARQAAGAAAAARLPADLRACLRDLQAAMQAALD